MPTEARRGSALAPNPQVLSLAGGRTRVIVEGPPEGEVVLFVPGMTYPLEAFALLSAVVVQSSRRSVRFDLYGRGRSSWNRTPLTPRVLAEQAVAVLAASCPGQSAHLVGLSNADLILFEIGMRRPERVRSLTLLAPSGLDMRTMNWRVRLLGRLPLVSTLLQASLRRRCTQRMAQHRSQLPRDAPGWAADIYDTAIDTVLSNPDFAEAVGSQLAHLPAPEAVLRHARRVSQGPVPVLMLTFAEEADATEQGLAPLRTTFPRSCEVAIDRGSHMALLECPDAIAPHLINFLNNCADNIGNRKD